MPRPPFQSTPAGAPTACCRRRTVNPMAWGIQLMTKKVWDEDKEKWCPLSCYEDTIFETRPNLTMVLQDELPRQKRLSFKHDDGSSWSHHQFVNAVADAYL